MLQIGNRNLGSLASVVVVEPKRSQMMAEEAVEEVVWLIWTEA